MNKCDECGGILDANKQCPNCHEYIKFIDLEITGPQKEYLDNIKRSEETIKSFCFGIPAKYFNK